MTLLFMGGCCSVGSAEDAAAFFFKTCPMPGDPLCAQPSGIKETVHEAKVLLRLGEGSDCFGGRRKTTAPSLLSKMILPWPSLGERVLESPAELWALVGAATQPVHRHGSLLSNKQVINALSVHLYLPVCLLPRRGRPWAAAAEEEMSPCLISR